MFSRTLASATLVGASLFSSALAQVSNSQYWHERYHGILSMAAYGDYATLCPQQTFTYDALQKSFPGSTEQPWTLLMQFGPTVSGLEGFIATIPEMDKVVIVFKGLYGWETLNQTAAPIQQTLNLGTCVGCTAHQGALTAYLEAKEATNDWEIVKETVNATKHQWSVTGHNFGGMVAQIAAIDLGWRGLCHWSHSHGSPRVFNAAAANLYNKMFAGEAGQRCVANEDSVPNTIPEGPDYTHTLTGFHIWGTNTTYGMNYDTCVTDANDPECLGGNNITDNAFYYVQQGSCGAYNRYNAYQQNAIIASESAAFVATATANITSATPSSSTMLPNSTSSVLPTSTSSLVEPMLTVTAPAQTVTAQTTAAPSATRSSGAETLRKSAMGLAAVVGLMAVLL